MERKNRRSKSSLRGIARFCAVQALYRFELCKYPIEKIIEEFNKNGEALISENIAITEMDKDFFCILLDTVGKNIHNIDVIISQKLANNWKIERLDSVTRCILRLGITELKFFHEIPSNVIFNEYIEIAKAFFESDEVSFINGLLNEAAITIRH